MNAAGSINGTNQEKILQEVDLLADTGIGGITFGSITVPSQVGNEAKYGAPVYYPDPVTHRTYNSMGLPNIGEAGAIKLIPEIAVRAHDKGKILIASGSPTNSPEHGSSVQQAVHLGVALLGTEADLVEINVSCPNVVVEGGGRKPIMGYDLETMEELLDAFHEEVGDEERLALKLPPYLSEQERLLVPDLAKILLGRRVFKVLVGPNTIPGQIPRDAEGKPILTVPEGKGGMSGPDTAPVGHEQLVMWREELGDSVEYVSTEGLHSGADLMLRRKLGAAAAGGVSFLWNSPNWKRAVTGLLSGFAEAA